MRQKNISLFDLTRNFEFSFHAECEPFFDFLIRRKNEMIFKWN